jgi:C1A family cysteine protease
MSVILDVNAPERSLNDTRRLVRAGTPVVIVFTVPSSFATVAADGYVPTVNAGEHVDGAHSALITGWVPNELRPKGAPEAAGGGYFVVKNSWGKCAGDAGYYYLAYDWVKTRAINLTAVF